MKNRHIILLFLFFQSVSFLAQYQVRNYYSLTGKKDVPVNFIAQDHNGLLWLATPEGAFTFDGKIAQKAFEQLPQLNKNITCLFIDSRDRVWMGTQNGNVFVVEKGKPDSIHFNGKSNEARITSITEIGKKILIGTYGNGVFMLENDSLTHFNHSNGLSDDVVYKVIDDGLSKVWCATDAGISELKFSATGTGFRIISDKNGLPDNIVRDIFLFGENLCIAMQDSGICFFDHNRNVFRKKYFFDEWSKGPVLNAFTYSRDKTIIATEKEGLLIIKNSVLTMFDYKEQLQCSNIN